MMKPELLLPAGDLQTAKRAIDHGADAVYVGLDRFSARAKAKNFSFDEMREVTNYAHERGAKIFCALNILLFNDELEDAIDAIVQLVGFGVDAFIVQDFGLATLLLSHFPEVEVHASTQMAVMNVSGAQAMEALGFDRVVLARETSMAMMKEIRKRSDIDLEVFVQGALCVSYSGLCYMSSLQGNRSGNRGQCAQPCRRRYALKERKDGEERLLTEAYLLSPKDLNLLESLPALMQVPVQSLKIEGRMKQPEYVALMTDIYREHIDRIADGESISREKMTQDQRNMAVIFNREGFTKAYFENVPGRSMMSLHTPKNTGIPLGTLVQIDSSRCTVRLQESLHTGDGIALYDANLQPIWGGYIDHITDAAGNAGKAFTAGSIASFKHGIEDEARLRAVALVYKTFDKDLSKSLLKIRSLPISVSSAKGILHFYVTAVCDKNFVLDTLFENENGETQSYHWASDYVVERSRNGKSSKTVIEGALQKLANTAFRVGMIEINGQEDAFVPMSVVTKAKNAVVEHFDCLLASTEETPNAEVYDAKERKEACLALLDEIPPQIRIPHKPRITVQVRTLEQVEAARAAGADELNILLQDTYRHDGLNDAAICDLAKQMPLLVSLPPLMKTLEEEHYYAERCRVLADAGIERFMISNIGQLKLLDDLGIEYTASDYQMNLTNDLTASALSQIGVSRQTISIEMDYARMQALSAIGTIPLELIVYGRLPAMHTRCCPMGNIVGERECDHACSRPCVTKDYMLEREGHRYDLASDQFCNVYVLNDCIYSLYGHLAEIKELAFDYWRVVGTYMNPQEIKEAVRTLATIRDSLFSQEKETPMLRFQRNTTDGHFIKGVR